MRDGEWEGGLREEKEMGGRITEGRKREGGRGCMGENDLTRPEREMGKLRRDGGGDGGNS